MPQMAPINWIIMFMMFIMTYLMFNMMNFFLFQPVLYPSKIMKTNNINYNWKW